LENALSELSVGRRMTRGESKGKRSVPR